MSLLRLPAPSYLLWLLLVPCCGSCAAGRRGPSALADPGRGPGAAGEERAGARPRKETDRDGDAIPDDLDACPKRAETFNSFRDTDGCPEPDEDLDGIVDECDLCPTIPENYGCGSDDDGCPEPRPPDGSVTVRPDCGEEGPLFVKGSSRLGPPQARKVQAFAGQMRWVAGIERLAVVGHVTAREVHREEARARALSAARARAVMGLLVQLGVERDRLLAVGAGFSQVRQVPCVGYVPLRVDGRELARWDGRSIRGTGETRSVVTCGSSHYRPPGICSEHAKGAAARVASGELIAALRRATRSWTPLSGGIPLRSPVALLALSPADLLVAGDGVARHDGTAWSRTMPAPAAGRFLDIWGSGPSEVYAAGGLTLGVHRHDGSRWSRMKGPAAFYDAVWGSGSGDLFAVGRYGTLARLEGRTWHRVPAPTGADLRDVWGSGPRDVYAAGDLGTVLHFDGSRWARLSVPGLGSRGVHAIWGGGPHHLLLAGESGLLRYDGKRWSEMTSWHAGAPKDLWGSGPSDIHAVSESGHLYRYDGRQWRFMPGVGSVRRVRGSGAGQVVVLGTGGIFRHTESVQPGAGGASLGP